MNKVIMLIALFIFTLTTSVYSENLKVGHAKENPREAVLVDEDTGAEWLVREGDYGEGSIIREVHSSHVTIATPLDARRAIATKIPMVDGKARVKNFR